MNRIKISPLAMTATQETQNSQQFKQVQPQNEKTGPSAAGQGGVRVRQSASVFVPMHYEKNYAYPLIVWLHSADQDASEVHDVMPRISMRNYVGVAPEIKSNEESWQQDGGSINATHEAVIAAVDQARRRFNINPQRIFLAGFGAGATMAFRVALERPELFAGVLALNGPLPTAGTPLCQWERARKLPVFWAQCRKSNHFDQQQLCQQLRLLHIAGFSLTLRQYPGVDKISDALLADVNRWIMESVNTKPANNPPQAR
jgi:phospholipase/carboxylesterase